MSTPYTIILLSVFLLALSSCVNSTSPGPGVPFKEYTGNYFFTSNYDASHLPTILVIDRYTAFDSLYHWIQDTSMIIRPVDMQANIIIGIVMRGYFSMRLSVLNITLESRKLSVYYTSTDSSALTYAVKNHALVLVSRCEFDSVRFYRNSQLLENPFIDYR